MGSIIGLGILIWGVIGLIKYANKHSLLKWKEYKYYDNGNLQSMSNLKLFGTGYKYIYKEDGTLYKKQYMHHRTELENCQVSPRCTLLKAIS